MINQDQHKKDIEFLSNYNLWRRGDENIEMPEPKEIGECIDRIVEYYNKSIMSSEDSRIGKVVSALGTCGMSKGVTVTGILTKIDGWGAYLECDKGIIHLCNEKTIKKLTIQTK